MSGGKRVKKPSHHGKSPSQVRIEELQQSLADEKTARRVDAQEARQRVDLEAQFRTTAMNELIAAFDGHGREPNGLKELVRAVMWGIRSAHPLRGLPTSDTQRVGHPDSTSTEAAALAGGKRAMLRRWNSRMLSLANDFDRELSGSDEPKDKMPPKPRCRHRECPAMDKRLPYGSTKCPVCWRLLSEERVSA